MIGVVVWSSEASEKAVIWCEDHGALAYLQGRGNVVSQDRWPAAGDLLELDSETIGSTRHARQVVPLDTRPCPEIPAILCEAGATASQHLKLVSSRDDDAPGRNAPRQDEKPVVVSKVSAVG